MVMVNGNNAIDDDVITDAMINSIIYGINAKNMIIRIYDKIEDKTFVGIVVEKYSSEASDITVTTSGSNHVGSLFRQGLLGRVQLYGHRHVLSYVTDEEITRFYDNVKPYADNETNDIVRGQLNQRLLMIKSKIDEALNLKRKMINKCFKLYPDKKTQIFNMFTCGMLNQNNAMDEDFDIYELVTRYR